MNLNQLEYALALKKYGNFTKTSQHLGITQPALSLQIRNLEDEIGISLFDRSTNPIKLTEDGVKFLSRAQNIVTMSHDLKDYASTLKHEFKGVLKVGVIPTLSPYLVPLFSKDLSEKFPDLRLDIKESLTEEILLMIKNGELDAGIIATPIEGGTLVKRPILFEKFFYFSAETSEVNLSNLWLLEEGNCFRDQVNDICALNGAMQEANLVYRCNSIDSLVRMVEFHGGATILPELTTLSLSEEQEALLKPIDRKVREVSIIHRTSVDKLRFIEALEEIILKNIPSRMKNPGENEIVDPGIKVE